MENPRYESGTGRNHCLDEELDGKLGAIEVARELIRRYTMRLGMGMAQHCSPFPPDKPGPTSRFRTSYRPQVS